MAFHSAPQEDLFPKPEDSDTLFFEKNLWKRGHHYIAGVDEAGRGPLAGPVIAAAVVLPEGAELPGVRDSKQMTAEEREELYPIILRIAVGVSIGIQNHEAIDEINILEASKKAMVEAVSRLIVPVTHILVDGNQKIPTKISQTTIVKGDQRSLSISSASIVAKVVRDRLMTAMHERWPEFNFARNKGYGTPEHLRALKKFGPCPIHRTSFHPVSSR